MAKSVRRITTLVARGRKFEIVWNEEFSRYCAIEDVYLDENGCLTRKLNGIQMHACKTLDECVKHVRDAVEVRHCMDEGMSMDEAFHFVFVEGRTL